MVAINQEQRSNIAALRGKIQALCKEYNVYGDVVERRSSDPTAEPEYYIVAGMNELPNVDPKKIVNRDDRCFFLFYPHSFALEIDEDTNPLKLIEKTVEYCKEAEFTKAIFNEFRCEIPEVLRVEELYSLKRFYDQRSNKRLTGDAKKVFHNKLVRFFKKERSTSKFKQAWKKHYRSERFNSNLYLPLQYLNFFRRKNPEIPLKTLQASCENLKLTVMNEIEYQYFKKQMKKLHPDISYSVSDKWEVDHGKIKLPKGIENPFGESVTYDEYFKKREETFSQSGFDSVQNLNVSHWEFRNVTFRASDESVIASVLNPFRFNYVKDNQLNTVLAFGACDVVSIPSGEMMNFYSLAKAEGLPFYIDDHNQFADASLESVQVVYSQASQPVMDSILNQLVGDKIIGSHMITEKSRKKHLLANQIDAAVNKEIMQKRFERTGGRSNGTPPEK